MSDTTVPARRGQVVVPISARAIDGLDAATIAEEVTPLVVQAAAEAGGTPVGAPDLLKADELLARTDDPTIRSIVEETSPGSLYVVAEMIPTEQARAIARKRAQDRASSPLTIVSKPVLPGGRRRPK